MKVAEGNTYFPFVFQGEDTNRSERRGAPEKKGFWPLLLNPISQKRERKWYIRHKK